MNICLKTYVKQATPTQTTITVHERLPTWIESPCIIECTFQVTPGRGYYLLNLTMDATLHITCQRCLSTVDYHHHHHTELALCFKEEKADQLMALYDCMVIDQDELKLEDILADELHLFAPEIPHELDVCHVESVSF